MSSDSLSAVELVLNMNELIDAPHAASATDVCAFFGVNPEAGLTEAQVVEHRRRFGENRLATSPKRSLWELIAEQMEDTLVRLLLLAALVSFVLALLGGDLERDGLAALVEPFVILLILILNGIVAIWQDSNASASIDALQQLQPSTAQVLRGSYWSTVVASQLVPGDIIQVKLGEKVPADARVIRVLSANFRTEQSQLTGESVAVDKHADVVSTPDAVLLDKTNMIYSSTTVVAGKARAMVTATGMDTEIGQIQACVEEAAEDQQQSPLAEKVDEFGALLSKVIGVICLVVWLINIRKFSDPMHKSWLRGCIHYFKVAVALAVAAIPEGLPAVITTCLALGTRRMARRNAIVRHLPSVETLGCTTVICSDKTGTLTTNEMTATHLYTLGTEQLQEFRFEGVSFRPVGRVTRDGHLYKHIQQTDVAMSWISRVCTECNESQLECKDGQWTMVGQPTEAALKVMVEKLGCPNKDLSAFLPCSERLDPELFGNFMTANWTKLHTLDFTHERRLMSVVVENDGVRYVLTKGAPEVVMDRSSRACMADGTPVPFTSKPAFEAAFGRLASNAYRVLALAYRPLAVSEGYLENIETDLTFLGIVAIQDPPRPEAIRAVAECRRAGIKVIMITGDNTATAEAVARRVGIISLTGGTSMTGKDFEELTQEHKLQKLTESEGLVFSRTEPKHKQMIVKCLKEAGETTAMTGDGVNDAPALKQADIGIAMGVVGTEVAKEASDMVLADDNFSTIVAAVEEGRCIYNNMKAFIRYLISSNIGEVASIFLSAAFGLPEGLSPVQLLWVNLVTDGLPATALGFNPADVDVMTRPPRHRTTPLISPWIFFRYCVIGAYVGFATVGIFAWWYLFDDSGDHTLVTFHQLTHWPRCTDWADFKVDQVYGMDGDPCTYFTEGGKIKASTLSLTVLVVIEMLNALNALSEDGSLVQLPPWRNPWLVLAIAGSILIHCGILYVPQLAEIFGVVPLSLHDWYTVVAWSAPVIFIDEALKFVARRHRSGTLNPLLWFLPKHGDKAM